MDIASFTGIIVLAGLCGVIGGIFLVAYDDGKPFALYRRLRCKAGKHRRKEKKVSKYRCLDCGVARRHPNLKVVEGGLRGLSQNKFDL